MSLSDIRGLRAEAIRSLARNLFPGFYERGLSANKALETLRSQGLGYRRQDFLRDYAAGKQTWGQSTRIRFTNEDKVPSERILERRYFGVPDKYSLVFKGEVLDEDGNITGEKYFFYHRNSLTTRKQLEEDAESWFSNQTDRYSEKVVNVKVVAGYINPVWG